LRLLYRSQHPHALLAGIAMSHGVFRGDERDLLEPYGPTSHYERVMRLLSSHGRLESTGRSAVRLYACLSPRAAFAFGWSAGSAVRDDGAGDTIVAMLETLHRSRHPFDWLVQLGFCRGLLRDPDVTEERDWARLSAFSDYYRWGRIASRLGARVFRRWRAGASRAVPISSPPSRSG
jgi:hypothetical protein